MSAAARILGERGLARRFVAGLALILLGAAGGCSDSRPPAPESSRTRALAPAPQQESDAKLAYSHDLTIGLAPDAVAPHFVAARERCVKDATLGCTLVQSSIRAGSGPLARPDAQIQIRLPHASVEPYVAGLTAPLPGEKPGEVVLREQTARAEDLTRTIEDTVRRLGQLTDYRDRLTALSLKDDIRVEDLIRIAGEQSQVQARIEETDRKRRGLDERVDTELLSVAWRSDETRTDVLAPIQDAWARSGRILGDSAGSALRFVVASLPWLPIAIVGLLIVRLVWRLRRRRARPERVPIEVDR